MTPCPNTIRACLIDLGLLPATADIADSASLIDAGALDSLALMQVVTMLEARFAITVGTEDLLPENFDSIENIRRYVVSKLEAAA